VTTCLTGCWRCAASSCDRAGGGTDRLEREAKAAGQVYRPAEALHASRAAAAAVLDAAVAAELAPGQARHPRFRTTVTELAEERWGSDGLDAASFVSARTPARIAPLNKIASGGELALPYSPR
jgi:DNA repair protein RecN (Recombination protein N)